MKKAFLIVLLTSFGFQFLAQDKGLEYSFDKARLLLAQRNILEAIDELRLVHIAEPNNGNVNFLMGAAYTELPGAKSEALFHLKKAIPFITEDYEVGTFKEKNAPIHVYYYMAVALVEKNKCAEANRAYQEFKKYNNKVDQYYIDEVDRHMQKCPFREEEIVTGWDTMVKAPLSYNPVSLPERKPEKAAPILDLLGLVTQRIEYTVNTPLYGVQIGSNRNPSPTSSYSNIKNVDVFMDSTGIIRYVIGHFSHYKQAENLLKKIREKGHADAFIVNVNDERKYSKEVISYKNVNLRRGITGEVLYYVQLGAFQDSIPSELAEAYFSINGIAEYKRENKTVLAIGPYQKYNVALENKEKMTGKGISDAFVVAYNKGKRIPLNEAINYTEQKE